MILKKHWMYILKNFMKNNCSIKGGEVRKEENK